MKLDPIKALVIVTDKEHCGRAPNILPHTISLIHNNDPDTNRAEANLLRVAAGDEAVLSGLLFRGWRVAEVKIVED